MEVRERKLESVEVLKYLGVMIVEMKRWKRLGAGLERQQQ